MDERAAHRLLSARLAPVGDDAAVIDDLVFTTDMLHQTTDFPPGVTRYTAGWRAVGASWSDVAAMGASPIAAVAVYAAPSLDESELHAFLDGAVAVSEAVGGKYVGGDLDTHPEFTVASAALGRTDDPVRRAGAQPQDVICVTGTLGRSGAAISIFDSGEVDRANELFRFEPRVAAGRALAPFATAMMDSSDGLARSLHQLAEASQCGMTIDSSSLPIDDSVRSVASGERVRELGLYFGEDFELVCSVPADRVAAAVDACPDPLTEIGTVTRTPGEVTIDGDPLPDRGYTHGGHTQD